MLTTLYMCVYVCTMNWIDTFLLVMPVYTCIPECVTKGIRSANNKKITTPNDHDTKHMHIKLQSPNPKSGQLDTSVP